MMAEHATVRSGVNLLMCVVDVSFSSLKKNGKYHLSRQLVLHLPSVIQHIAFFTHVHSWQNQAHFSVQRPTLQTSLSIEHYPNKQLLISTQQHTRYDPMTKPMFTQNIYRGPRLFCSGTTTDHALITRTPVTFCHATHGITTPLATAQVYVGVCHRTTGCNGKQSHMFG